MDLKIKYTNRLTTTIPDIKEIEIFLHKNTMRFETEYTKDIAKLGDTESLVLIDNKNKYSEQPLDSNQPLNSNQLEELHKLREKIDNIRTIVIFGMEGNPTVSERYVKMLKNILKS